MALTDLSTVHVYKRAVYQPVIADELFPLMSWEPVVGDGLQIGDVDVGSTGTVDWVDPTGTAVDDVADPVARVIEIKRVMGEFSLGDGYQQIYSAMVNQQRAQADVKRLLMREAIGNALVNGTGAVDEPLGLIAQATQTITASSTQLTFFMLSALLAQIQTQNGHCDYFVMGKTMITQVRALYELLQQPVATVVDSRTGRRHVSYSGVPILRNDHLDMPAATDASILALNMDAVQLIYPAAVGERGLVSKSFEMPGSGATTVRLTQSVGVALIEKYGLATLTNVQA